MAMEYDGQMRIAHMQADDRFEEVTA